MGNEFVFPLTFSGVRPGEEQIVIDLIGRGGLTTEDLNPQKLVHFIVARRGDTIVGTVGLEPAAQNALLRSLVVAEDHRRQAVATRLVAAIEKYARSHGTEALYLLTMDAVELFAKQGYLPFDRQTAPSGIQATEEFRALCPATAQCLRKHLAPG
jgi:amino-acid N-acetyltransferase